MTRVATGGDLVSRSRGAGGQFAGEIQHRIVVGRWKTTFNRGLDRLGPSRDFLHLLIDFVRRAGERCIGVGDSRGLGFRGNQISFRRRLVPVSPRRNGHDTDTDGGQPQEQEPLVSLAGGEARSTPSGKRSPRTELVRSVVPARERDNRSVAQPPRRRTGIGRPGTWRAASRLWLPATGHVRVDFADGAGLVVRDAAQDRDGRVCPERRVSGAHGIKRAPQAEEVGAMVGGLGPRLFWCHVVGCTSHDAALGHAGIRRGSGQTEVG